MSRYLLPLLLLLVPALCQSAWGSEVPKGIEPAWREHPFLFVERSDLPKIRERAEKNVWATAAMEKIHRSADLWLEKKLEFPPSTGRHDLVYICPDCKVSLHTLSPTQHECPKCKKVYSGLPYDAVLYKKTHDGLRNAAVDLGLASLLFDDPRYARKALDILLGYADRYSKYPLLDTKGEQGKAAGHVFDQTLNEATWIIDMAWAYDLVLGAKVGADEEHRKVEEGLLRPAVEVIKHYNAGKSNWQSWHNAGIMAVGVCLKDRELVRFALSNEPGGFYWQMKNSVLEDGAWYEGSWSYHYYTLSALLKTAEAARHAGIDLYREAPLKAMCAAPLKCLMPDGRIPATHDGDSTPPSVAMYELPAARYGDRAFEGVLAGKSRGGNDALLAGIDSPLAAPPDSGSEVFAGLGAVVLRRGGQYLWLDFGPQGGGHGHLDKLSINYYAGGQVFAPDLGRGWPYNLPIHQEWYRGTLSHNTVMVDGIDQKECEGKLQSHDFGADYAQVTAVADQCYEGVRLKRTLAMGDDWLLDLYEASSDAEHTYDWTWYARAEFETALATEPSKLTGASPGYKYLSQVRRGDGSREWQGFWKLKDGVLHGLFKRSPGRQATLCEAPDKPSTDTLHGLVLRERAKSTRFVALFSRKPMTWSDLPAKLRALVERN